jgi:hypothetical protein
MRVASLYESSLSESRSADIHTLGGGYMSYEEEDTCKMDERAQVCRHPHIRRRIHVI